jgi:uncharacterized membrane protein
VRRLLRPAALAAWLVLIVLTVLWEGWLAPVHYAPPGFWVTLKGLPLVLPVFGLLHDRLRAYIWAALLLLPYFMEGTMIAWLRAGDGLDWSKPLPYAWIEILLTLTYFGTSAFHVRYARAEARAAGRRSPL